MHVTYDTQQTAYCVWYRLDSNQTLLTLCQSMALVAAGMIQVPCTADNTQQWEGLYYPVSFCTHTQYIVVDCTLFTLLLQCSVSNSLLSASYQ
jgi:hypothetical protein